PRTRTPGHAACLRGEDTRLAGRFTLGRTAAFSTSSRRSRRRRTAMPSCYGFRVQRSGFRVLVLVLVPSSRSGFCVLVQGDVLVRARTANQNMNVEPEPNPNRTRTRTEPEPNPNRTRTSTLNAEL